MARRLSHRFYKRPCDDVARALLGKRLVHRGKSGTVVETEAYFGEDDGASHARFGRTARNAPMYMHGGVAYVYLCYGIHDMFNIVVGEKDSPAAVLIRALAVSGESDHVANGPGKLTAVMAIGRGLNGVDLVESEEIYITSGTRVADSDIAVSPRIGVDFAGMDAHRPLRFTIRDHPAVSRRRK